MGNQFRVLLGKRTMAYLFAVANRAALTFEAPHNGALPCIAAFFTFPPDTFTASRRYVIRGQRGVAVLIPLDNQLRMYRGKTVLR